MSVVSAEGIDSKSTSEAVKGFVETLRSGFLDGTLDRVELLYMGFRSISRQVLRSEQFLPVTQEVFAGEGVSQASARPYLFEPDANTIFTTVLPLFLLSVMQEVFCENRASEQAARVMAMQSANDNAKKLLDQLQLEYNKLQPAKHHHRALDILGGQVR